MTVGITGWRLHIGLIFPSPLPPRLIREFYEVVPDGVDVTSVTLSVQQLGDNDMREASKGIDQACKQLAAFNVDLIYFLGVPPIVLQGPGFDKVLAERMSQASGLPAITDVTGVLQAMRHLDMKSVVLATPFESVINERIKVYLQSEGIAVTHMIGLEMHKNAEVRRLPVSVEYATARRAFLESPTRPDGIYVACGSWGSMHNIEPLEQDLDTRLVSWLSAFIWSSMRQGGVHAPVSGFGRLLASP